MAGVSSAMSACNGRSERAGDRNPSWRLLNRLLSSSRRKGPGVGKGKSGPSPREAPLPSAWEPLGRAIGAPTRRWPAGGVGIVSSRVLPAVQEKPYAFLFRLAAASSRRSTSSPRPSGGQQALIDHLADAATLARETPGWLSASLHRSPDGTRVVNYAQTDSLEPRRRSSRAGWSRISGSQQGVRRSTPRPLHEVAKTLRTVNARD